MRPAVKTSPEKSKPSVTVAKTKKLSYKLQRELDQMPGEVEALENQLESLQEETGAADFYQQDHQHVAERLQALQECESRLEALMERWLELEELQG